MLRFKLFNKLFSDSKKFTKIFKTWISTSGTINAGVKLAYTTFPEKIDRYEAPPLIIMHGLFGNRLNWRTICKNIQIRTKPTRNVITVDARNHGESPHSPEHNYKVLSEDIDQLLKDMKIAKAAILGHSMGGRAMMYFALKNPTLVEKAIVVDISPLNVPRDFGQMEEYFLAMKSVSLPANLSLAEGRTLAKAQLMDRVGSKYMVDFILRNLRKIDTNGFSWAINVDALHKNFRNTSDFPLNELASAQYSGPVLFVGGTMSSFIRKDEIRDIQKIFPNASISWLDAGHLVHLEKPEEMTSLVVNFLNSP